ncbi:DUF3078 domain-containing protein [Filimonas effusa]|uniref:DUF3078 domain-containing protein n=1 Tax=Filimonas effusa TaxID=2508721 RepID=A0A4Q1DAM2_9BACT|nr:DUF3078 domain-containing protein [Filimonas effusa]RXK86300.1 DUF3078 domain-containing protein [Filimonas effusa]
MMKFLTLFCLFFILLFAGSAQDMPVRTLPTEVFNKTIKKENDTAHWNWKRGGLVNLNASQGSLSNWAAGGDNFTLAINSYFNYFVFYKKGRHTWDNNLDMNFGIMQTTSLGSRKNDDRFDLLSKYGFQVDSAQKYYVSGLFNFRSQFFDGYTYANNVGTISSTLLSPAYLLFSLGMDYKPLPNFSVFLSPITSRATIVANRKLADKGVYGVPAGQRIFNQVGAFSTINYSLTLGKNVTYKGRMDLFSDYKSKPGNVDVYFTNIMTFKINRFLSASYNLDMIYDDDVKLFGPDKDSPALQVKSLLGIGFQMKLAQVTHQAQ